MKIDCLQQDSVLQTAEIINAEAAETNAGTSARLVGNELHPDEIDLLMCQLRKEEGGRMLTSQTSPGTPESVLAALVHGARRRSRGRRILFGAYYVFVTALVVAYFCSPARGDFDAFIDVVLVSVSGYALLSLWLSVRAVLSPMRWIRPKLRNSKLDDVRNVGHLAEALAISNVEVGRQAEIELTALLPQVRQSDGGLLSPEQRQSIYREMLVRNVNSKPEFLIAALGVVERFEDTRALPEVMALAERSVNTVDGRRVRVAAESCLQVLRQTESEKDARNSLLRAATADVCSGEELLRPAEHVNAVNPHELLRAQMHD